MMQRHEEPSDATDEYEKGTYVYFDYNIMVSLQYAALLVTNRFGVLAFKPDTVDHNKRYPAGNENPLHSRCLLASSSCPAYVSLYALLC